MSELPAPQLASTTLGESIVTPLPVGDRTQRSQADRGSSSLSKPTRFDNKQTHSGLSSSTSLVDTTASSTSYFQSSHSGDSIEEGSTCVGGLRRVVYITLAGFFFVLGMIGVVLPGLPTTPFLLLTSYLLARSWPRMNRLLLSNRLVGPILRQWQRSRTVKPRVKLQAAGLVFLAMLLLVIFSPLAPPALGGVLGLASIGLLVIYRLPTAQLDAI